MIKIEDFKKAIEENTLENDLIIFKCKGNSDFLFHQYLRKHCLDNELEIKQVDNLDTLVGGNLFTLPNKCIIIYEIETLNELPNINIPIWIKCKKISSKITKKFDANIIELPSLEEWQLKDYVTTALPKVDSKQFMDYYKANPFRLEKEVAKVSIFNAKSQPAVYGQVQDQLFIDKSLFTVFDLVNAIIRKDKALLKNVYLEIDSIDVDPFGLLKLLIDNFFKVISIQLDRGASAESLGLNSKQFWAIKNYSCGFYSKEELTKIYQFLVGIDSQIKLGMLDTKMAIDYILVKILSM